MLLLHQCRYVTLFRSDLFLLQVSFVFHSSISDIMLNSGYKKKKNISNNPEKSLITEFNTTYSIPTGEQNYFFFNNSNSFSRVSILTFRSGNLLKITEDLRNCFNSIAGVPIR